MLVGLNVPARCRAKVGLHLRAWGSIELADFQGCIYAASENVSFDAARPQ